MIDKPSYEELENEIDELKKVQQETCEQRKKEYNDLFSSMSEMYQIIELIYDTNGKPIDYYYRNVNPAFERLVGKTRDELIDKRVKDIFVIVENHWFETYDKVVKTGEPIKFENYGAEFDKYYEIFAWRVNDNLVSIISNDITERKIAEQKLIKAKQKAEESDQLKTEFLNNMSHEIRTPMNGILGFSEMLSNTDLSDEKRNNFVKIIQNSGNQLLNVIDDILEISRLKTKQVEVIDTEVNLNDLFLELFSIYDVKARENKTPLYVKKGLSDIESTILIDKTKLYKILSNLLENALKFTDVGFIEFGYTLKNNKIEIYVKDTGIGIALDKQEIIFDRFSQAEKDLSKKAGGLGLGLSIAKENTELLGGKISVTSEFEKGAIFKFTIPFKPVHNNVDISNLEKKYTILIAEDEETNYLLLETLIFDVLKIDCTILKAKNGKESVEICKSNTNVDLVLMDLKMPVMNGFEATKQIKELYPDLPIIAQTAYSSNEDKVEAILAGCDDFISKPIKKDMMQTVLENYLIMKKK